MCGLHIWAKVKGTGLKNDSTKGFKLGSCPNGNMKRDGLKYPTCIDVFALMTLSHLHIICMQSFTILIYMIQNTVKRVTIFCSYKWNEKCFLMHPKLIVYLLINIYYCMHLRNTTLANSIINVINMILSITTNDISFSYWYWKLASSQNCQCGHSYFELSID